MPMLVISDGKIVDETLNSLQITKDKFNKKLEKKNINAKNVFLMTLDRDGNENIIMKGGRV